MLVDRSMTTTRAKYGIYGSWTTYIIFFAIAALSLLLIVLTDLPRVLLVIIFTSSAVLLVLLIAIPQLLFGRVRTEIIRSVITSGVISQNDRILDIGTGRGFLAVEIARRVPRCYVFGIDLWDAPASGEIHKGFVLGNAKKSAEKNAE